MNEFEKIKLKLKIFKKKYFLKKLFQRVVLFFIVTILLFLLICTIEYIFWLNKPTRLLLFIGFIIVFIIGSYKFLILSIINWLKSDTTLKNTAAAKIISKHFSKIEDILINAIQLSEKQESNALVNAAIEKKSSSISSFSFSKAINFNAIKPYLITLSMVVFSAFLISFINPSILLESSYRISHFGEEFEKKSPFQIQIVNEKLETFKGEDFHLKIKVNGLFIPKNIKLIKEDGLAIELAKENDSNFNYLFSNVQQDQKFRIAASGYYSKTHNIVVHDRPNLISMEILVNSPDHTKIEDEVITNNGDIEVLVGSKVRWHLSTNTTDDVKFMIDGTEANIEKINENSFMVSKIIKKDRDYQIILSNEFGKNKSNLSYKINALFDKYPELEVVHFLDSLSFEWVTLAGSINDDFGILALDVFFKKPEDKQYQSFPIDFNKETTSQSFFYNWNLEKLNLTNENEINFFLQVKDNDKVSGPKATKSPVFNIKIPEKKEVNQLIDKKSKQVTSSLGKSDNNVSEITEKLKYIEERLKTNKNFSWQENKLFQEIIKERKKLEKHIEQIQKQYEEYNDTKRNFYEENESIKKKNEQLKNLITTLADNERKKLYDKIQDLLEKNQSKEEIIKLLQKLNKNELQLKKDLERVKELFKRLEIENLLNESISQLDKLSKEQENLSNTLDNQNQEEFNKQEKIKKEFSQFEKQMNDVVEKNQLLKHPQAIEDFSLEEKQISKELKELSEDLKDISNDNNNTRQQIKEKQKSVAKKMDKLSKKLSNMQSGMQLETIQVNIQQLRLILDDLVKLSFNQEKIFTQLRGIYQSDPKFLELSAEQLQLKNDIKIIQDSLQSLAERTPQISSYITKEILAIDEHINEATRLLKNREKNKVVANQQLAMTAINNLALLLDNTLQQMQLSLSNATGKGNKPQKSQQKKLSELQKKLGEKMEQTQKSGKKGRELSKDLVRLSMEQEMLRKQYEKLLESIETSPNSKGGGEELQKAIDLMKDNEIDLVNKRLTRQLINRQKQILTRMLEAEKSQKEQEEDQERESEKPENITKNYPPDFHEFFDKKRKEIELLQKIPLDLNLFYKKEVNQYFKRISLQ